MNKTKWEIAWDEAQLKSSGRVRTQNEAAWAGYWDEVADEYLSDVIAGEPVYRAIVDHLTKQGAFRDGDSVLDIGCGPGTYALLFAERARQVDALDSSAAMLDAMLREAAHRGLSSLRPLQAKWEELVPEGKYDLAFSAMSPAIRDVETLLKLEACSTRSCCLVTYGENPDYGPINDLWGLVIGKRQATNAYHYVYPYNLLREIDRKPTLEMFVLERAKQVPVDRLVRQYVTYFSIFTTIDAHSERLIREYFEARSDTGLFEVKKHVRLAAICWDVPGEPGP
ncbi:class I SAM-dependent methyltransferase [Methanosarcina sp. UBA289]|uniref:class I SAM-dependent methyltransferase n=1 Tax=Methanosarcina sp. UBA289 TaxID=1915574 RepID=UPI0025E2A1DE|nr:class I SAM-dependent methyltransferase [Methanosarcina sp. UBA289]